MVRRNYLYIIICLLFQHLALGQGGVEIFADTRNNDTLQKLVTIFTEQLKKSTGGNYNILPVSSYQGKGIYLNSSLTSNQPVKPSSKLRSAGIEAYSIEGNEQTVQITGNCNMAIGHGIFSYLELLGYRYYFANPAWYIIPDKPVLFKKWSVVSSPSYDHRRIWFSYGTASKVVDADFEFWKLANKMEGAMNAIYGHAYEEIAIRNKDVFSKHPEWFYPTAEKGTIPLNAKFDMTKEDLVQTIIKDVEDRIEASLKNKTADYKMITLGPSDGTGTCNTPACQQLGTYTDRVFYLVNRVAKAVQKKYPSTLIGCLAYSEYIAPPTKKVEPNVFAGITTAFNTSKYSTEQLIEEWRKKGAIVGIYDYFSWYYWDLDIPGQSLASKPGDVTNNIKKYHAKGAKAYDGESSTGWMDKGLGYYLAAKQMWDVKADAAAAKKEFFSFCFNNASGIMQKLWNEWERYSYTTVREGDLARWIDYTFEAEKAENDNKVKKRLLQIRSYLHYLVLYRNYQQAKTEANLAPLLNFAYRKVDDGSVASAAALYVLGNQSGIPGMAFDDKAKWKNNDRPVSAEEINQLIRDDRSKLKTSATVREFLPAQKFINVPGLERYSKVIADSLPRVSYYWYENEWLLEIKNKGAKNYIDFIGNHINNPTVTKPIKITIYPYTPDGNVSGRPVVFYYEYAATKVAVRISLEKLGPGYYTLIIDDPVKLFELSISPSVNYSMVMRPFRQIRVTSLFYAFIYVPEGTKRFNVMKTGNLGFITPTGRKVDFLDNKAEEVRVEVQPGEAGLWRIKPVYGDLFIEGIPPYMGTSAPQMLIPAGIK